MAFISIPDSWIQVGQALVQRLFQRIKDDLDSLFAITGTLLGDNIVNGFFEVVEDEGASPLRPADWTVSEYLGGTVQLDDGTSTKGKYALLFTRPGGAGNGGGDATSDYFPVDALDPFMVQAVFWATPNANVRIKIDIDYFDEDKVFIIASTQNIYNNNATNPTARPEPLWMVPVIPTAARYMKFIFIGGDTDTDPGTSTNIVLDNVAVVHHAPFAAGDLVVGSSFIETSTTSGSTVPAKDIHLDRAGTLRITFDAKHLNATGGEFQIYRIRGGVPSAVGTLFTAGTSYSNKSEDVAGWRKGDILELRMKQTSASAHVKNLLIKSAYPAPDQPVGKEIV